MTEGSELLAVGRRAMELALDTIRSKPIGHVTAKGDRDTASEVDYAVEDRVRTFLADETPEIGFLGEERGGSEGFTDQWVLDPVDGTANFVHGLPLFGVSLALLRGGAPTVGLVSLPMLNLYYSAELGAGSQCNADTIHVSRADALNQTIVSMGDFAVGEGAAEKNVDRLALMARLASRIERLRMLGSAAHDLAWVAHGKLGATIILSNQPWDTAAGVLIAREAGAVVVDTSGAVHTTQSSTTVALAPGLANLLVPLLSGERADED